jgi:Tol biopolymer transport system component
LSDRTGTEDIWVVKVAKGKIQGSPQPLKREVGQISPRGFTQDGHLYFNNYTRWFTLQTAPFNMATGELQGRPATFLGSNFQPDWSPDGKHLAYVAEHHRWGGDWRLHVRDQSTGEERELVGDLGAKTPRWSPDGRYILFRGWDRSTGTSGFYQVEVQTGVVTSLVEGFSKKWASIADWSPHEESIYYVDSGRLVRRDLVLGQEKELYSDPHLTRLLILSPDGKWLVFGTEQSESEPGSLLIMPTSGGAVKELFKKPEEKSKIGHAVWTPDGKYILFTIDDYQLKGTEVWRITPEGGNPEKLWRTENEIAGLSIHPSGQEIAFSLYTQESGIWVMEEYLAAIK